MDVLHLVANETHAAVKTCPCHVVADSEVDAEDSEADSVAEDSAEVADSNKDRLWRLSNCCQQGKHLYEV